MRILFSADLHGNQEQYRRLFGRALKPDIDAVVIGGDIAPKDQPFESFISTQRLFIRNTLKNLVSEVKNKKPNLEIYVVMGNDDARSTERDLQAVCDQTGMHYLQDRRYRLDADTEIIGYAQVPITPFIYKDWEKHDLSTIDDRGAEILRDMIPYTRNRRDGAMSIGDAWHKHIIPVDGVAEDSIQQDLAHPMFTKNAAHTVYVLHGPPALTHLDRIKPGHVGSIALRQFIEKHQPLLTLHGHIHETVDISGKFSERIGNSVSISCGNDNQTAKVAAILVDTHHPHDAQRHYL